METQKTNLEELRKQFKDYKDQKKNQQSGKKSGEDILKKYFTPRNDEEIFRILPPKDNKKHIQEAFFHVVQVTTSGGKKRMGKIYCPAHNEAFVPKKDSEGNVITDQSGKPVLVPHECPLCEKSKKILKRQDPSVKGKKRDELNPEQQRIFDNNKEIFMEANKWEAKKFYIVRGIDKGKTGDGIKFWRFKHNFKNQGVFDKLVPVLHSYIEQHEVDFADPEKGTDLSITVTDGQFNNITYKQVSAIIPRGPSKLHNDPLIVRQWLNDPITWRDVFKPKSAPNITPHQYLEMLVVGKDPYWDDSDPQNKKWVFPDNPELERMANERNDSLDGGTPRNFEQASDVSNDGVSIENVTEKHVGDFTDKGTDVGQEVKDSQQTEPVQESQTQTEPVTNNVTESPSGNEGFEDYDDLPF